WWPTKGAAGAPRIAATKAQGAENAAWMAAGGKSAAQQARRAAIGHHPVSRVPLKTTQTRRISTSADHSHARARRPGRLRRWSPTEEIGWSRTQEIRWYPSQEIGWVRSEEILQSVSIQIGFCPHSPVRGRLRFSTGKPTKGIPKASTVSSLPSGRSSNGWLRTS